MSLNWFSLVVILSCYFSFSFVSVSLMKRSSLRITLHSTQKHISSFLLIGQKHHCRICCHANRLIEIAGKAKACKANTTVCIVDLDELNLAAQLGFRVQSTNAMTQSPRMLLASKLVESGLRLIFLDLPRLSSNS